MSSTDSSHIDSLGRLSAAEAAELASGLAELSKAGLPLPAGLRALADEWPTRRLRPVLLDLADRVEHGVALEDAIAGIGARLPIYLRGLITSGIRSGRLAEALEEYVNLERTQHDLRRQVWINLAYPTLLMLVMCILAVLANLFITNQMMRIYKDFGTGLPGITTVILKGSGPLSCALLIVTALMLAIPLLLTKWPGSSWISPSLYILPFVGPLLRWSQMARFSRLMAMLLEQKVPLADSLRLTAKGVNDAYLARACREAADGVEQGRFLSDCLAARRQFSRNLIPLVVLGERTSALGEAFQSAAEMFEGRANTQGRNLETFLLPGAFILIICFCGVFIIAIFMPLIALITRLTGGH